MAGALAHRGPDDQGVWADAEPGVGLCHRRLAIVDLSPAGHQPMHSASGRYVLTFNGEIYNHQALRAELEGLGAVDNGGWRGHSDTETLVEAIAAVGLEAAIERCVGMFAFALWDRKQRRLSLVRDRFGEKPLYYGWVGRNFVFASELKAIRAHPNFAGDISRAALHAFTARNYVPAPLSIYQRIYKLEPGCILTAESAAASAPVGQAPGAGHRSPGLSITRYWSHQVIAEAGLADPIADEEQALEQLELALAEALQGQSMADVPVGAFLSGGIDSSTIVALYQKYSSQRVRTFTIGFEEAGFNEADHARAVARHFGTQHHERIVTARDAQDLIPQLPQMYDEPFADSSQIPTHLVSRFAREQVTVALSGDGGDELFGGYNRYVGTARLWSKLKLLPRPLRAGAAGALGKVGAGAWNRAGNLVTRGRLAPQFGAKVRKSLQMAGQARGLQDLYTGFLDEWAGEGSPVLGERGVPAEPPSDLASGSDAERMMHWDAVGYLPDDILCKVDRAAMAVSLETRVPFLDHRVAAVAARVPLAMKIRGGAGKQILRKLLYREAPQALFERPKAGFAVPVGAWLRGDLRDWVEDLLDPAALQAQNWFDSDQVHRRWQDHLSGRRDSTAALWSVLMFQSWLSNNAMDVGVDGQTANHSLVSQPDGRPQASDKPLSVT
jgi:asparagine synthase (glutamine-hydrolysing)